MRIAMIGTRGVPARYGGFETAVEEIGKRLAAAGHEVVVYCRGDGDCPEEYDGMRLVHLPAVRHKVFETLSHSSLSVMHQLRDRADVAILFNAANAPLLPVLRGARIPVATHVDGLEWRRAKWGPVGRAYYLRAERLAVRWSDALIADARGIQDYYRRTYGADSVFIPYGATVVPASDPERLSAFGLEPEGYHLVVARLEPENHVDLIVEGYARSAAKMPLVVVGSVPYPSDHVRAVERVARGDDRIRMVGGVWDQVLLDSMYGGAASYFHGHSVGGTNPSLLRAMGAGTAVNAFDVNFNREVLGDTGTFFSTPADVAVAVEAVEADLGAAARRGKAARERAISAYVWDHVAVAYEELCFDLRQRQRQPR